MKTFLPTLFLLSFFCIPKNAISSNGINAQTSADSLRIIELDQYWELLTTAVLNGDFETYSNGYHKDAVVIFAMGKNKTSMPISKALTSWKRLFIDTKNGKIQSEVQFRFSQRIGDESTAHETGIFIYKNLDNNGKILEEYIIHFEMLLVKRNNKWLGLMEYQKSEATKAEWDALQN
ncbi:MAG: hypothetical protein HKN22_03880 [Bacteroidia bacterium]|nr:hypothetical protein [Bacteroidia bacterium]